MPTGTHRAAEEFYSLCLSNARVLDAAARRYAESGDPVGLLACAWGSDVQIVQAVLWERIMVASPTPQRQFFRVAEALFAGLHPSHAGSPTSCADVLTATRAGLLEAGEPSLRDSIRDGWYDLAYAVAAPSPTIEAVAAHAHQRLEGMAPGTFVGRRREQMAAAMADAQALRVRGETVAAVQRAYEADFLGLEAYLVESSIAAGDAELLSFIVRWELAVGSVAQLAGLPEGFVAAVAAIRDALGSALSEADAARLRETLLPV